MPDVLHAASPRAATIAAAARVAWTCKPRPAHAWRVVESSMRRPVTLGTTAHGFMTTTNLIETAARLPTAWKSTILGNPGRSQFKVVRMDGAAYPAEQHAFVEALLVLEGVMKLEIDGVVTDVKAGEVYLVPAGQPHSVAAGSHGTLVIIDDCE